MKIFKNFALLLFILLSAIWVLKMRFRFYFPENIYITFVMIKDFQLAYFLGLVAYKIYFNKKRRDEIDPELNIQKRRKLEFEKLYDSGARDYILDQKDNDEKLIANESELRKLENENVFFDNAVLWLTIVACVLQIICFLGQKM